MIIEKCSLIGNKIETTYFSDPGMILITENAGVTSFQVLLPFISPFESLLQYQNYIFSCNGIMYCRYQILIYFIEIIIM